MATKLWRTVWGGSATTRLFSAYLALVLAVAMVGPGLAVYASEDALPLEPALEAQAPEEIVSEPVSAPVSEPVPEPISEPVSESEPDTESVPAEELAESTEAEASVERPDTVTAEPLLLGAAVLSAGMPVLSPDDNPPLTSGGVKIEDPSSGTYNSGNVTETKPPVPSDFSIELVTYETDEGWFFDFVSNYPVIKVVVKGGDGANLYTYDPAVMSDTGLHAPANASGKFAGLSHLDFYFGTVSEPEPEPGNLTVYKFRDDNENGQFDEGLGEVMLQGWAFTLRDSSNAVVDSGQTGASGSLLFADLEAGEYSVTETLKDGWKNTTPLTQSVSVTEDGDHELWFGNVQEFLPFTELDLAITKQADTSSAKPGELITYTLTYRNLGDLAATNYTIVDDYDERYVTVVDAMGGVVSGGTITWSLAGPLTKEAGPQTLTYTVRVKTEMPVGTTNVDNIVVISHPLDDNPANDRDDERVVVTLAAEEQFLPFTGSEFILLLGMALVTGIAGLVLRTKPLAS